MTSKWHPRKPKSMQPTTESNTVTFETGDRIRTDTGDKGQIVVVSPDGAWACVQLDGSWPSATMPVFPVTQLSRLTEVGKLPDTSCKMLRRGIR